MAFLNEHAKGATTSRFLYIIKRIIWPNANIVAYVFASMVVLAIASIIFFDGGSILMYGASILSFYLLILGIANGPRVVNLARFAILTSSSLKMLREEIESTEIGRALLERDDAREILTALPGIIGGLAYAIFNLTVGIMQSSLWLASVGIYTLCLATGKIYIVHGMQRCIREDAEHLNEWERRRCRLAGIWLAVLTLIMTGIITQMIQTNKSFDLSGLVLYVYAFYTVYAVTFSIANIYLFRFSESPVRFALKAMHFARALMSLLVLQTALVGNSTFIIEFVKQFMNAFTGIAIIVATFITAIVLLWKGKPPRELKPWEIPGQSWYRKPTTSVRSGNKIPHKRRDRLDKKKSRPKKRSRKAEQLRPKNK